MIEVITTEKRPIKLWVSDADAETLRQAKNLANLPFTFSHIALMPDAHVGFGMPIGGVLATEQVIVPNAVGVDIGCGMCALQTSLENIDKQNLTRILSNIRNRIPLGFKWHDKKQDSGLLPAKLPPQTIINKEYEQALYQVGTLGGGNHFIEIQKGSDGKVWIMIHSGSRNLGKKVAEHYNNKAKKLNNRWFTEIPASWDLAFLPLEIAEAHDYISEMNYCVDFALANRKLMMQRVCESIFEVEKKASFGSMINIAHNYAALETHFGKEVWVHRKGATRAGKNETGIIPGSQGSKSFIVKGLGNSQSFESCSHGAGRKLGRNQAIKTLDLKTEIQQLDDKGIIHSIRTQKDLEEATGAYKDINVVMKNQSDLVEIVLTLEPLAVIKG
jgi:tRNA-splicing ligase RtcB